MFAVGETKWKVHRSLAVVSTWQWEVIVVVVVLVEDYAGHV